MRVDTLMDVIRKRLGTGYQHFYIDYTVEHIQHTDTNTFLTPRDDREDTACLNKTTGSGQVVDDSSAYM